MLSRLNEKSKNEMCNAPNNLIKINWHLISCECWLWLIATFYILFVYRNRSTLANAVHIQFPLGNMHSKFIVVPSILWLLAAAAVAEKQAKIRGKKRWQRQWKKCKWISITTEYIICDAVLVWPIHPFPFNNPIAVAVAEAEAPPRHNSSNWKPKLICTHNALRTRCAKTYNTNSHTLNARFSFVDNISFKFCYGFVLIEYVSVIAQTSITHNWIQSHRKPKKEKKKKQYKQPQRFRSWFEVCSHYNNNKSEWDFFLLCAAVGGCDKRAGDGNIIFHCVFRITTNWFTIFCFYVLLLLLSLFVCDNFHNSIYRLFSLVVWCLFYFLFFIKMIIILI